MTLVHDWLWHRRGTSAIVSIFLLKRLNLVTSVCAERDSIAADNWTSPPAAMRISA
jgi:hypothetical protein